MFRIEVKTVGLQNRSGLEIMLTVFVWTEPRRMNPTGPCL